MKKAIGIFLLAGIAGFTGAGVYSKLNPSNSGNIRTEDNFRQPARFTNFDSKPGEESTTEFVSASEQSVPAVVHVKTTYGAVSANNNQYYNPFQDFFWGDRGFQNPAPSMSSGSGVIITDDGYVVTNNHVVANSDKVEVTLNDKRTLTAKVIGTDPSTDLALLKIDDKGLPFVPYGNSDNVKVGEWVLAVGNPFNLTSTVTAGIVSAKARNIHILP
ncbi:MAG TPA: trypsin-like peptidase domain-containing protein, partial [Bacteroidia bacterium]|nr:trypsin-like peptidase domain-containing protein [Bacteroidia bacterium]